MAGQDNRRKAAAQTGLYLIIITAIVVVANILSAGLYTQKDVTKNERYTLSEGSGSLVKSLKGPLQVDAYVTRGLASLDTYVRDLTELLKQYEKKGGENFKFTIIEPKTDEEKKAAGEEGLQEMPFAELSQTKDQSAAITQGYMGLVFKYGSEKLVIPALDTSRVDGLEFWISNKIREIRDKADGNEYKIGVVTGKDELKLTDNNLIARQQGQQSPSIQQILTNAFPFYKFEDVDLKDGETEIDPKLRGLIITQPRKDYTDKELRRIDQFLMRGGKSLVVWASAVTMKPNDATMKAELNLHGLDKLLGGYGIKMNKDAVLDHDAQFRLPILTQSGVAAIGHPGIVHAVNEGDGDEATEMLDDSFAGFFRMAEMAIPFPSSLELEKDKQPDATLKSVARTSQGATVTTADSVDMALFADGGIKKWTAEGDPKSYIIAATVEAEPGKGKLKAALGTGDGIDVAATTDDARILVVSSSEFITNPFAYAGNGPEMGGQFAMFGGMGGDKQLQQFAQPYAQRYLTNTILSVKNTLDWMSGDADLLAASAKLMGDPNISYKDANIQKIKPTDDEDTQKSKAEANKQAREKLQGNVQYTLIFGMPLFFMAFGFIRWQLRNGKRAQMKI
ncbi:MAG: GldG family protein [Polyangiaceae bacterium]